MNSLKLNDYKKLLGVLPIRQQAFNVKAKNWEKNLNEIDFKNIFKGKEIIYISREDLFIEKELRSLLLKIILWGYPKGMRGKNFALLYKDFDILIGVFKRYPNRDLNLENWFTLQRELNLISGLGLSTYSKMLYFLKYTIAGTPTLILDDRLLRVFKNKVFEEFDELSIICDSNKKKMYFEYLNKMRYEAQKLDVEPENLEQFLFVFGNNLK